MSHAEASVKNARSRTDNGPIKLAVERQPAVHSPWEDECQGRSCHAHG
jgi:hypothetical protein